MTLIVRNLSDRLVEIVRDRVLSGAIIAAGPIRQDALAAELGVSKIPLREALARLEEEGLLENHANRGFFVRSMSATELEEIYALRVKLEPDVIALAAERATVAEHRIAIDSLALLDRATDAHIPQVGSLNRAFHVALFMPSDQPVTTGILNRLHILSERYVRKHLEPLGRDDRAKDEHHGILEAWLARDATTVARLTREHTEQTLDDLREQLGSDGVNRASGGSHLGRSAER